MQYKPLLLHCNQKYLYKAFDLDKRGSCNILYDISTYCMSHIYLKSMRETRSSGSRSTNSFHRGLLSIRAQRSHRALMMAATARWITPFSGPSCLPRHLMLDKLDFSNQLNTQSPFNQCLISGTLVYSQW